jgi:hypothetical protein
MRGGRFPNRALLKKCREYAELCVANGELEKALRYAAIVRVTLIRFDLDMYPWGWIDTDRLSSLSTQWLIDQVERYEELTRKARKT